MQVIETSTEKIIANAFIKSSAGAANLGIGVASGVAGALADNCVQNKISKDGKDKGLAFAVGTGVGTSVSAVGTGLGLQAAAYIINWGSSWLYCCSTSYFNKCFNIWRSILHWKYYWENILIIY